MLNTLHKVFLIFFSIALPLSYAILAVVVDLYHDGYYVEGTVTVGQGFIIQDGKYTLERSGELPEGYTLEEKGNKLILWGPPPSGTKLHLEMSDYWNNYARPTKLALDALLNPYIETKLFMQALDKNVGIIGLVIAISGVVFDRLSKHYGKQTIVHVYRINVISVKIIRFLHNREHEKKFNKNSII